MNIFLLGQREQLFYQQSRNMGENSAVLYQQEIIYDIMPFNNPICKQTYQSLPRIYGHKKASKKRYLHIASKINTKHVLNIPKYSLTPDHVRRINLSLYPQNQRYRNLYENGTMAGLRANTEHNQYQQQIAAPKSYRKVLLKPVRSEVKSFHLSDLETSHKVNPKGREKSQMGRPTSQLEKMMAIQKQNGKAKPERPSQKGSEGLTSHKNQKKLKVVSMNMPETKIPHGLIFNRYSKQFNQIQEENQQQNSEHIHSLNERKLKNTTSETNSQSQKSAISLSRHVFNEKRDPTMFRSLEKKINSSRLNSSRHSRTGSVLDNGLFRIPEEKDYKEYISKYKPMGEKFSLAQLLKKPNFKIIRDQKSVYFGQTNQNDQRNGQGVYVCQKQIFEGEYQKNLRVLGFERNIDGIYIGGYQNGVRAGEGMFRWNNGEVFLGNWQKGMKNGFGKWKSPQGHYYQGQWHNNRQHGKGTFKHSVSTYKGQFVNFLKHGYGEQVFQNGDKYVGQYQEGKPEGKGKYQWHKGGYYEGSFKVGKREGYGVWVDSDGTRYEGQFQDDSKHGKGRQVYKTGQRYEGLFKDGYKVSGKLYNARDQQMQIIVN